VALHHALPSAGSCAEPASPSAQTPQQPADGGPRSPSAGAIVRSDPTEYFDSLVGPIALYPDALIALILPASTEPSEVANAAAYLAQYGDMSKSAYQPWDPSVRALAHYSVIIAWMDESRDWSEALGSAFVASPAEVMGAIQRMRARAVASGLLVSTPQQRVATAQGAIFILPARPGSIYVPLYDAAVVFDVHAGYLGGSKLIDFSPAYSADFWLSYVSDWQRQKIWICPSTTFDIYGVLYNPGADFARRNGAKPWLPSANARNLTGSRRPSGAGRAPNPAPVRGAPSQSDSHKK
jgi:hypothetical protein